MVKNTSSSKMIKTDNDIRRLILNGEFQEVKDFVENESYFGTMTIKTTTEGEEETLKYCIFCNLNQKGSKTQSHLGRCPILKIIEGTYNPFYD